MNLLSSLGVAALAAHRATRAVTADSFTLNFRKRAGVWADAPGARSLLRKKLAGTDPPGLVQCPHCIGFWAAGVTTIIAIKHARPRQEWWMSMMQWWAVAGAQTILASMQGDADAEAAESRVVENAVKTNTEDEA